jgi:hypothetical protein
MQANGIFLERSSSGIQRALVSQSSRSQSHYRAQYCKIRWWELGIIFIQRGLSL